MDLSNKVCPTETQKFLLENHIPKEAYHGGELTGEHCDMVMDKIEKLEEIYPDEHKSIIDGFKATQMVNKSLCGRVLKENWKESLASFEENILFLHGKYSLSITPKLHILMDHVGDYIEMTGKPLGYISDQTVEKCHQLVNSRFEKSNYYVKCLESDIHGENLLKGIKRSSPNI